MSDIVLKNDSNNVDEFAINYSYIDEMMDEMVNPFNDNKNNNKFKNNTIIDDNFFNKSVISRTELNYDDGYTSYSLFDCNKINNDLYKITTYGENISDIAFHERNIGIFNGFLDVEPYVYHSLYSDTPTDIVRVDMENLNNKNSICKKYSVISNRLFNSIYTDINRFVITNCLPCDMLYSTLSVYSFFISEILNTLFPKIFVIVGDTKYGVNILEYNILDGLKENLKLDIKNRLRHIVETMRLIVSGRFDMMDYGGVHVKLTVTPLESIISFGLHKSNNILLVPVSSIYNQFSSLISNPSMSTYNRYNADNSLYYTYCELSNILDNSENTSDVYSMISLKSYVNVAGYESINDFLNSIGGK